MEGSILELLEQHGSLAYEQIAAHIHERPDAVRNALADLRERGLVDVLSVGELVGNLTNAAAYWRLTAAGRGQLARVRSEEAGSVVAGAPNAARTLQVMGLTAEHRELLETIGPSGATNQQLGDLVNRPVFAELVAEDYIRSEQFELAASGNQEAGLSQERVLHWHLTPRGTQALNIPPFDE